MFMRIDDFKNKEVISVSQGQKIGFVGDVEIDSDTARLSSIVVYGKQRFFGIFGREEDCVIPWESITVIGEDTVLVNYTPTQRKHKQQNFMSNFFDFK